MILKCFFEIFRKDSIGPPLVCVIFCGFAVFYGGILGIFIKLIFISLKLNGKIIRKLDTSQIYWKQKMQLCAVTFDIKILKCGRWGGSKTWVIYSQLYFKLIILLIMGTG